MLEVLSGVTAELEGNLVNAVGRAIVVPVRQRSPRGRECQVHLGPQRSASRFAATGDQGRKLPGGCRHGMLSSHSQYRRCVQARHAHHQDGHGLGFVPQRVQLGNQVRARRVPHPAARLSWDAPVNCDISQLRRSRSFPETGLARPGVPGQVSVGLGPGGTDTRHRRSDDAPDRPPDLAELSLGVGLDGGAGLCSMDRGIEGVAELVRDPVDASKHRPEGKHDGVPFPGAQHPKLEDISGPQLPHACGRSWPGPDEVREGTQVFEEPIGGRNRPPRPRGACRARETGGQFPGQDRGEPEPSEVEVTRAPSPLRIDPHHRSVAV
jgi:hypothetical protein